MSDALCRWKSGCVWPVAEDGLCYLHAKVDAGLCDLVPPVRTDMRGGAR